MRKNVKIIISILVILSFLFYSIIILRVSPGINSFAIASLVNSALFIILAYFIFKYDFSKNFVYITLTAGIIFRIMLMGSGPIASDDIYRYAWDGKVLASGINPYKYSPDDPALTRLHTNTLPSKINFPNFKSIYPPAAQLFFLQAYLIGGDSFYGIKILLLICEILTLLFIILTLQLIKQPVKYSLIYAMCPLPIMQFMVDGHIDALGILFLSMFIYLYKKNRKKSSYILLGFSIISKIISVILIPLLFFIEKKKNKTAVFLIPLGIAVIAYSLFSIGESYPFESMQKFAVNWMYNGSIFKILHYIIGNHFIAREICLVIFIIILLFLSITKREFFSKIYYIFLAFFLLATTVHPWYLTWLVLLLPFYFRWSGIVLVSLVSLVNIDLITYIQTGIWRQSTFVLFAEYLPVFLFLILEIYKEFKIGHQLA